MGFRSKINNKQLFADVTVDRAASGCPNRQRQNIEQTSGPWRLASLTALNTNSKESAEMFAEIVSALTFVVYFVVPQVLWAWRRGR
jgi:hypothetical protein